MNRIDPRLIFIVTMTLTIFLTVVYQAHADEPPVLIAAPEPAIPAPSPECGLPPMINVICMKRAFGPEGKLLFQCIDRDGEQYTIITRPEDS